MFAYRYYRDKHLKYTRCVDRGDRKFPCHLCSRSFEKRDRLRIHVLHVHEKHRPHKVRRPRRYLWVFGGRCFCPPDRSQRCPSRVEAVGRSGSPKRRTRREPLPRRRRTRCGVGRGNGTGKGWGLPVRHRHALLLRSPTPSFVLIFKILFLRCLIFRQRPFSWNR